MHSHCLVKVALSLSLIAALLTPESVSADPQKSWISDPPAPDNPTGQVAPLPAAVPSKDAIPSELRDLLPSSASLPGSSSPTQAAIQALPAGQTSKSAGPSAAAAVTSAIVEPPATGKLERPPVNGSSSGISTAAPATTPQAVNLTSHATGSGGTASAVTRPSLHAAKEQPYFQASSSAQPLILRGRLEEIGGRGATLPAGIVLNLKTQTAHVDPTFEKKMVGRVASFPVDWQGSWGGTLSIWSAEFDPQYFVFDSEAAAEEREIETPGTQGTTTFNFFGRNGMITLQPATIKLPMRQSATAAKQLEQQLQGSPLAQMLGGNNSQLLQQMAVVQPMMVLGDINGADVNGNAMTNQVVKNDIRQLKPGVIEQNLLVQEQARHHQTGQVRRTYSETVLRFTRLNPTQLYVQAASVKYGHDGHFMDKVVMYGTVTRGVIPDSGLGAFSGFPGMGGSGFGGADSSGGLGGLGGLGGSGGQGGLGGLGDLNKLMKELQGQ